MADFAAVLRKTIAALRENTPEARDRIYQKARSTIEAKLQAVSPPPSSEVVERQMRLLEDAIQTVEAEYAPAAVEPEPVPEPENDFDRVLRDLEALSSAPAAARWSVAEKKPAGPIITTLDDEEPDNGKVSALDEPVAKDAADTSNDLEEPSVSEISAEREEADEPEEGASEGASPAKADDPEQPEVSESERQDAGPGDEEKSSEAPARADKSDLTLDETFEDRPALRELRSKRAAQQ